MLPGHWGTDGGGVGQVLPHHRRQATHAVVRDEDQRPSGEGLEDLGGGTGQGGLQEQVQRGPGVGGSPQWCGWVEDGSTQAAGWERRHGNDFGNPYRRWWAMPGGIPTPPTPSESSRYVSRIIYMSDV